MYCVPFVLVIHFVRHLHKYLELRAVNEVIMSDEFFCAPFSARLFIVLGNLFHQLCRCILFIRGMAAHWVSPHGNPDWRLRSKIQSFPFSTQLC